MTMEILSNFISIYCLITFIVGAGFMLAMYPIAAMGKDNEPRNKVHFYVARDMDGLLCLYISKPLRSKIQFHPNIRNGVIVLNRYNYKRFGLNEDDYANLKWEDEPVEVFLNMED